MAVAYYGHLLMRLAFVTEIMVQHLQPFNAKVRGALWRSLGLKLSHFDRIRKSQSKR